jgi:LPXTG-motif cell wall-anchored protein
MRRLSAVLAVTGAAALVLMGASPALAAGSSIDPGDSLYAIDCDDTVYNDWQLMSVESTTGTSTTIGDGSGSTTEDYYACAGQPAYDPTTGKAYYIQWHYDIDPGHYYLASIDLGNGDSTTVGEFFYIDGEFPTYPYVESMAIGLDGSAYALAQGFLWSVDLTSGELTPIGESLSSTYSFAVDPTTGAFYAIDSGNVRFSVDVTDGSYVNLDVVVLPDGAGVYSLQIDGGGRFWIMADDSSEAGASLWSFAPADAATPTLSGEFIDDPYYTEALLIVPGAALAATGADFGGVVPLAAGGAALALAGVALLALRRRRTA